MPLQNVHKCVADKTIRSKTPFHVHACTMQ